MNNYQQLADIIMCVLWVLTYLSVFLIMFLLKETVIPPTVTILGIGMELGIFIVHIWNRFGFNYITFSYGCWSLIEIGIIALHIKLKNVTKQFIIPYFLLITFSVVGVIFWTKYTANGVTYCNFILTIIGMIVWIVYIYKKKQVMHWSFIIPFSTKFLADLFVLYAYFGFLNWFIDLLCVLLPVIDSLFLILFFTRIESRSTKR